MNENNNFNNNGYSLEEPPVLSEIKKLNESTKVDTPTMDALGPMNLMPNTLPNSDDNVINSNNYNNMALPTNNMYSQNNSEINSFDNMIINQRENDQEIQSNINTNNFFVNTFNNNDITYDNMNLHDNFTTNQNTNNQIIQPNIGSVQEDKTSSDSNLNYEQNTNISPDFNLKTNELDISYNNSDDSNDIKNNSMSSASESNVEISDMSLNIPEKEDLNLDSSYENPDVLEIIDIDNDPISHNNLEKHIEENNSKSLDNNILKIKNLIDELKNNGLKIELSEFDFDKFYQVIIKIEK